MECSFNLLAAILVTCLLQVMMSSGHDPACNLTTSICNCTSNCSNNDTNNNTNNDTNNNTNNDINNSTSNSIVDANTTVSHDNSSADVVIAEVSSAEEVVLAGTPVMTDCVNGTSDFATCLAKSLNITKECANETGATQEDVDIAMRMEIPSSDTGKCLTRCLLKYRGVMTPEGAFAPNATANFLNEVHKNESLQLEYQKLADYCYGKLKLQPMSSLDTCQFAYDIAICTEEYHKTLFLRNPAMAPPINAITTP